MPGAEEIAESAQKWPLAPGTCLGKYQIVRFLGEGGMGAVYEGLHLDIGKRVAIKVISPALALLPEARARFLLEAQLTSRVRHPHTVDVTDVGMETGQAFLVMEYLEGEDLAKHIMYGGLLPLEHVTDIALPVLAAVAAAHEQGIVHRDLKPQNIFLARMRDGSIQPKVLDFGISKAPATADCNPVTTAGGLLGSPSYFAPEQVHDPKAVSPASDQYALGVILYECVTGRLPYEGSSLQAIFQDIVTGGYEPASRWRADLPEGFQAVIAKAMRIDPADRYPSVLDMGRALLPFASTTTRLLWDMDFVKAVASGEPPPTEHPFPAPVTEQMPGPMRAASPPPAPDPKPPRAASVRVEPSLTVPRRFRASWAVGAVLLVAAPCLLLLMASRGASRPPPAPAPTATTDKPSPPPAADPRPVERVGASQASEVSPEPMGRRERPARTARRLRLGTNKAPLIE
jgi:serine/threonine protein kinase